MGTLKTVNSAIFVCYATDNLSPIDLTRLMKNALNVRSAAGKLISTAMRRQKSAFVAPTIPIVGGIASRNGRTIQNRCRGGMEAGKDHMDAKNAPRLAHSTFNPKPKGTFGCGSTGSLMVKRISGLRAEVRPLPDTRVMTA